MPQTCIAGRAGDPGHHAWPSIFAGLAACFPAGEAPHTVASGGVGSEMQAH